MRVPQRTPVRHIERVCIDDVDSVGRRARFFEQVLDQIDGFPTRQIGDTHAHDGDALQIAYMLLVRAHAVTVVLLS